MKTKQPMLKAQLHLSRLSGGDETTPFRLTVTDDNARVQFLEVWLTIEQFADFLTNRTTEGGFILTRPDLVGTTGQNKTENVPFARVYDRDESKAKKALKPFEVDGWRGDVSDMFNGHRSNKDGTQSVIFRRHVKLNGEPVLP